jgi:hypothetical protein
MQKWRQVNMLERLERLNIKDGFGVALQCQRRPRPEICKILPNWKIYRRNWFGLEMKVQPAFDCKGYGKHDRATDCQSIDSQVV